MACQHLRLSGNQVEWAQCVRLSGLGPFNGVSACQIEWPTLKDKLVCQVYCGEMRSTQHSTAQCAHT